MRNTIKKFNSHIYLYYEYKALLKIKAETFNRDYFVKAKKRIAKTITDENKKKYYFRGKRKELKDCEHVRFMVQTLTENNRLDLLNDDFFEMDK